MISSELYSALIEYHLKQGTHQVEVKKRHKTVVYHHSSTFLLWSVIIKKHYHFDFLYYLGTGLGKHPKNGLAVCNGCTLKLKKFVRHSSKVPLHLHIHT